MCERIRRWPGRSRALLGPSPVVHHPLGSAAAAPDPFPVIRREAVRTAAEPNSDAHALVRPYAPAVDAVSRGRAVGRG